MKDFEVQRCRRLPGETTFGQREGLLTALHHERGAWSEHCASDAKQLWYAVQMDSEARVGASDNSLPPSGLLALTCESLRRLLLSPLTGATLRQARGRTR